MGVKLFRVIPEVFAGWRTGYKFLIKEGFPEDAKVIQTRMDGDTIEMEIWSASFPEVSAHADRFVLPVIENITCTKDTIS